MDAGRRQLEAFWAFAAGAVAFVVCACVPYDGDFGFHLAIARWILEHGWLPLKEPFAAVLSEEPFRGSYPLGSLLIALPWIAAGESAGDQALQLWKALLSACAFGAIAALPMRRGGVPPPVAGSIAALAACAAAERLLGRPLILSAGATAALLWWLSAVPAATPRPRTLLAVALLSTLWAWVHPEWWLGTGLLALHGMLAPTEERRRWLLRLSVWVAVPVASFTILHPAGASPLFGPVRDFVDPWMSQSIVELQRFDPRVRPAIATVWLVVVAASAFVQAWRRRWRDAAFGAVAVLLAVLSWRFLLPGAVLSVPIVACAFEALAAGLSLRIRATATISAMLLAVWHSLPATWDDVKLAAGMPAADPRGIAGALEKLETPRGPLLCSYATGSLLLREPRLAARRVLVDGRFETYGGAYLRDIVEPIFGDPALPARVADRIGAPAMVLSWMDVAMTPPGWWDSIRAKDWRLAYWDSFGALLLRGTVPGESPRSGPPRGADPFRPEQRDLREEARAMLAVHRDEDYPAFQLPRLVLIQSTLAAGDEEAAALLASQWLGEGAPPTLHADVVRAQLARAQGDERSVRRWLDRAAKRDRSGAMKMVRRWYFPEED